MNQGVLYVVATPIGHLDDFSPRACTVLRSVFRILAEDTRHSARLLQHYAIDTPMMALHEHNEQSESAHCLQLLQDGKHLALISDAGTPLISDPGYRLVRLCQEQGIKISPVPGASAMVAALSVAGLASDRFVFEGFLPARSTGRRERLISLAREERTMIFYEAPHRVAACLQDMLDVWGSRKVCLCRELTKQFETVRLDDLAVLTEWVHADPMQQRGELVLVVEGASAAEQQDCEEDLRVLDILLATLPMRQAVDLAVEIRGGRRNWFYSRALERQQEH